MRDEVKAIKRVADVRLGKMVQPSPASSVDVEAAYLRAAHVQPHGRLFEAEEKTMWFSPQELRNLNLISGDVAVVEGGAGYGRSAYVDSEIKGWGFQNSIIRVRPRPSLSEGRFLNYVFHSLKSTGETALAASVATIPHYTADKLGATRHWMPSVKTQMMIADFLDRETAKIDAMIEAQQHLITALRARRLALVVEAVHLGVREDRLPKGWSILPFKAAISRRFTGEWGLEAGVDDVDVLCVRVADFDRSTRLVGETIPTVRSVSADKARFKALRPGDLLLERSGGTAKNPVGNVVLYIGPNGALSSNFIECLRLKDDHDPHFWCYLQEAAYSTGFTHQHVKQTTGIQNLDVAGFYAEHFAVPNLHEQRRIVERLDAATARVDAAMIAANNVSILLRERREALITAAVTGRIDPETGIERVDPATYKEAL